MDRNARPNPILRWRATGSVVSSGGRGRGGVRGLSAAAHHGGRGGARGAVLGRGGPICSGQDRFGGVGSTRIGTDGVNLELGSGRGSHMMPPPPPPPPKSTGGVARKSDGPPRGRPPSGMVWCRVDQDWKPDPNCTTVRRKPYCSSRKRSAPAPRGRPPEGTRWCGDARAYVMKKTETGDVGKTRFKIEVPSQSKPVV